MKSLQVFALMMSSRRSLVAHALLLLTSSTQVCWLSYYESGYLRAINRAWRVFFFPNDYDLGSGEVTFDRIFTLGDLIDAVDANVATYYDLAILTTTEIRLAGSELPRGHCLSQNKSVSSSRFSDAKPPTLLVTRYNDLTKGSAKSTQTFHLNPLASVTEALGIGYSSDVLPTKNESVSCLHAKRFSKMQGQKKSFGHSSCTLPLRGKKATRDISLASNLNETVGVDPTVDYFSSVKHMTFSFDVCDEVKRQDGAVSDCYHWQIMVNYNMGDGTGAVVSIESTLDNPKCHHEERDILKYLGTGKGALELVTLLMASIYSTLLIWSFRRAILDFYHAKRLHARLRRRLFTSLMTEKEGSVGPNEFQYRNEDQRGWGEENNIARVEGDCKSQANVQPCNILQAEEEEKKMNQPNLSESEQRDFLYDNLGGSTQQILSKKDKPQGMNIHRVAHNAAIPTVAWYRWSSIPFWVRMRFFSPWLFTSLFTSLAMVVGNALALWTRDLHTRGSIAGKVANGFVILILWASFISHLRAMPKFFQVTVLHTVGAASLFFLALMSGVLPVFIGFAIMGYDAFGFDVANFGSFDQTCKTLFSVLNGDSIFDIYMQLERRFPNLGNCKTRSVSISL